MSGRLQLICVLLSLTILPAMAAEEAVESAELPEIFNEPIPLYTKGLGTFTRPISSANKEAQAYFNQGFQMMYAFAKQDATRSFREAHQRDPNCAICFWGEAWSWGSYLNGPMGKEGAPHAYAAIQKAIELAANHATPIEQAYIEANRTNPTLMRCAGSRSAFPTISMPRPSTRKHSL